MGKLNYIFDMNGFTIIVDRVEYNKKYNKLNLYTEQHYIGDISLYMNTIEFLRYNRETSNTKSYRVIKKDF
jgi:hypothetical protein